MDSCAVLLYLKVETGYCNGFHYEEDQDCSISEKGAVVTTRAHVHYVVTEYGITNLTAKTSSKKGSLAQIAHPSHQNI